MLRLASVVLCLSIQTLGAGRGFASDIPATNVPTTTAVPPVVYAPETLPGNGLAQHPFLYTGEWDHRKTEQTIFVVRGGKIVWTYSIPIKDATGNLEELGDATMLSNGNIVFCRKVGASEITPDKKIVWDYPAPKGTEIHSVQPLGLDRVLMVINGNPAKLMIINTKSGNVDKEMDLPTPHPTHTHLQFRRVRLTQAGTYLAAHLDNNEVDEYDPNGKVVWTYAAPGPWDAVRLKNGNTLITISHSTVIEVNPQGKIVWQFSQADAPNIKFFIFQEACRLANGNTVICNWCPVNVKDPKACPDTVQVIEVTPDKKVVWALRSWDGATDLGPASSIQLLDEPGKAENGDLQR